MDDRKTLILFSDNAKQPTLFVTGHENAVACICLQKKKKNQQNMLDIYSVSNNMSQILHIDHRCIMRSVICPGRAFQEY